MKYCTHLKKRKNRPYCKLIEKEISLSYCRDCDKKEYKTKSNKIKNSAKTLQNSAKTLQRIKKKSNKLAKLEKNRYSLFTDDLNICYICGRKKKDLHEIFGGRNRINSIKYGFILPLCRECHSLNQNNPFFNDYWHKQGQTYWEEYMGSREEFIKVFRRNYLE